MNSLKPIYSPEPCTPAYQLNWCSRFLRNAPLPDVQGWLQPLGETLENKDAIRLLEHRLPSPDVIHSLPGQHEATDRSRLSSAAVERTTAIPDSRLPAQSVSPELSAGKCGLCEA